MYTCTLCEYVRERLMLVFWVSGMERVHRTQLPKCQQHATPPRLINLIQKQFQQCISFTITAKLF